MRRLLIFAFLCLIFRDSIQAQKLFPSIELSGVSLSDVQFKSTHNSYERKDRPNVQIDEYNVWDIELDFFLQNGSDKFWVGHNGPNDDEFDDLTTLDQWIANVKLAKALEYHPIILKLELKGLCGIENGVCRLGDPKRWDQGNWQTKLSRDLEQWLEGKWITRQKFRTQYGEAWPSVQELREKFIVTLQTYPNNEHLMDQNPDDFFISGVPLIEGREPWIENPSGFGKALKDNMNRLIMNDGYKEPWSNVLVHSPCPSVVNPSHRGWQWGTFAEPFQTVGHAINANWTHNGESTAQIIVLNAGNYDEKITISTPVEFHTPTGPVTIGGKNVAYTIVLSLMDVADAGTTDPVYVRLRGTNGSTGDYVLDNLKVYFDRAGAETFWVKAADIGALQDITIGVAGDDDVYIDDIVVISAITGRKAVHAGAWVGYDHANPMTFSF